MSDELKRFAWTTMPSLREGKVPVQYRRMGLLERWLWRLSVWFRGFRQGHRWMW